MKLELNKVPSGEFAVCPETDYDYACFLPWCRKKCDKFNGYKTMNRKRYLLCKCDGKK